MQLVPHLHYTRFRQKQRYLQLYTIFRNDDEADFLLKIVCIPFISLCSETPNNHGAVLLHLSTFNSLNFAIILK